MKKMQKKGLKKYLPYFLGICILLAAIGSCSTDGNVEEWKTQVSELEKEKKELTQKLEKLEKEKKTLETQAEEDKEQIEELKSGQETEVADYEALKTENETLKTEKEALESQISELQAQIEENEKQKISQAGTGSSSDGGAVSTQSESSNEQQDTQSYIVYITKTGDKYHRDGCRYLRKSQIAIEKDKAVAQGYSPCSVCNP